ncbi:hypothetical protein DPMN_160529 [Dreissena polymorpha]|uniref:Uncharacterized protein n=1 Tax=Dreissena polymorpha TaxID=45954 RepID=A0A9D4EN01_DREPO|nr:hypothetical protein DPMN_160529 [Dreissena polymorpha]
MLNKRASKAQNIIWTNLLTKFHEDWTIKVASREKCPAPGAHDFKETKTVFEQIQDIIGTNVLTNFHDDRKINVTSRVLTWFYYSHITKGKIPRPRGGPCFFKPTGIIFELLHEDRTINVVSRPYSHIRKKRPALGTHNGQYMWPSRVHITKNAPPPLVAICFKEIKTIFELIQDIIGTILLTKFHEDLLTRKNAPPPWRPCGHEDWTINVASRVLTRFNYSHIRKNATPLGSHDMIGTNLLTKFHEDRKIIGMTTVIRLTGYPFRQEKINVASSVLTRKNAQPSGGHVFQPTGIIFELLLTKFHEDRTINVACRVKTFPARPIGSHDF